MPQLIELLRLLSNKGVRHVLVDLSHNFISDVGVNSIIQSDVFGTSSKCLIGINIDNNIAGKEGLVSGGKNWQTCAEPCQTE